MGPVVGKESLLVRFLRTKPRVEEGGPHHLLSRRGKWIRTVRPYTVSRRALGPLDRCCMVTRCCMATRWGFRDEVRRRATDMRRGCRLTARCRGRSFRRSPLNPVLQEDPDGDRWAGGRTTVLSGGFPGSRAASSRRPDEVSGRCLSSTLGRGAVVPVHGGSRSRSGRGSMVYSGVSPATIRLCGQGRATELTVISCDPLERVHVPSAPCLLPPRLLSPCPP